MSLFASLRAAVADARTAAFSGAFAGASPASPKTVSGKSQHVALGAAMALATVAVLASRRTSTLTTPYLWAEDGLDIVPQFVLRGWPSLFDPISGYMAFIPRLMSYISLSVAPQAYPLTSTLLSWLFMAGVLAFIALAPTRLRARPWVVLACLFVPTDPEVFGTSLYSFWWAGLLLMVLALWEDTPRLFKTRLALAVLCGLSTPLTVMIAPLMALRAVYLRARHDVALAAAVAVCAGLQVREILAVHTETMASAISPRTLAQIFDKFFGRYIWGMDTANASQEFWLAVLGLGLAGLVVYALATLKDRWLAFCLLYLLGGSIALSVMRVSVEIMGPTGGGPRYFFYPYVLLGWILIQALASRRGTLRALFAAPLAFALANAALSGWNRAADTFSFQRQMQSCMHFEEYGMPIHRSGSRFDIFRGTYPRRVCAYIAARMEPMDENRLRPFSWLHAGYATGARHALRIVSHTLSGTAAGTPPAGYAMRGTYGGPSPVGEVILDVRRGEMILYASGAGSKPARYDLRTATHHFTGPLPLCPETCTLAFGSDLLPETFTVRLSGDSGAPDDWFAVGLPAPAS